MPDHPYTTQPTSAFWSRAVARDFDVSSIAKTPIPLISPDDLVMSAGSCFAANIVPYLEKAGLQYLRTESIPAKFQHLSENFGYRNFSAAYGNVYTPRQLLQLFRRAFGTFQPIEDRWPTPEAVYDPFRQGLRYPARSNAEFDILTAQHLKAVREAFQRATVLVFTLGLTEAWLSKTDGAVFPACPGTIAGTFDPDKHAFHNFTAAEITDDLRTFVRELRAINPSIRIILTVSPVPLVATATDEHVLSATIYSKSVLRVAAGEIANSEPDVSYFPAYEIVTGPQAPYEYFEADRREPSKTAIEAVMGALLARCQVSTAPVIAAAEDHREAAMANLSNAIANAECEEAAADL